MAQLSGMSVSAFYRNFQAVTGDEPHPVPEADPVAGGPAAAPPPIPTTSPGSATASAYDSPSQFQSAEYPPPVRRAAERGRPPACADRRRTPAPALV
ncbi:hypothetical protein [Streptosporangium vulgare]|uniref:hypothetical protein n=1 Tax=Streptosporangium vulgare TaxID=46190 RepID=UPI003CD07C15